MRLARVGSTALVLAVLTACGTTVQNRGLATADGGGGGLGAPTAGAANGTGSASQSAMVGGSGGAAGLADPAGPAVPVGAAPGTTTPGLATSGSTGGSLAGGTTGANGAASGRGFTKTTISLGVATADDYNAFASSFGLKGVAYDGDPNIWFKAVADDINAHGGLLGRKIVLVKHDFNTAQELNDPASANQTACVAWTQDRPVFAVLFAGFLVEDTLLSCLQKAQTPLVYPGAGLDYPIHYQQTYTRFPLFFNLAQMVGERFDRLAIGRLVARHFFEPWDTANGKPGTAATPTRIGLIGFDDRDGAIQLANQQRELARHGLKPGTTPIRCPRALTDKIQCEQSAVLKFATAGVTHVFGADTIFMKNADSQNYHPRYFVHTSTAAFAANAPESQLRGAMGENYVPFNDVDTSDSPGDPTPATASCRKLMKNAGQASTDPTTLSLQMSVCDEFYFLRAAVSRAGALGAGAVRAGFEALGTSQQSALTWTSFLGPSEHTSARALRDLVYRSDKGRFFYASTTNYGDS